MNPLLENIVKQLGFSSMIQGNGPSRLARHSEQNDSSVNDMRFTSKTRKTMNDTGTSCPTVKQLMTLASVYERADAYNRAALEPVIRRAWERATIYAEER